MRGLSILILFALTCGPCLAQKTTSTINLDKGVLLTGTIEPFDSTKHKYDTCDTGLGWKSICLIDGKIWFGADAGRDLPRNSLTKLTIKINGAEVPLDITGMYNPSFKNELTTEQFKLKQVEVGHVLFGHFSDGAGTYTAHWTIIKNKSMRNKISTDESDFYWRTK
jgi:hypothetical protein